MKRPLAGLLAGALLGLVSMLAGCATPAIPKGYTGPRATVVDTLVRVSSCEVNIFELARVDEHQIVTTTGATMRANQGMGGTFAVTDAVKREIPAKRLTLRLHGGNLFACDAQALFGRNYDVVGELEFTPQPNRIYQVNGILTQERCAVWIEDAVTHKVVSDKLEKKRKP